MKLIVLFLCLNFGLSNFCLAQTKEIALTIDDLPFVGECKNFHLTMLIRTLKDEKIPATGFIIASEVRKDNWSVLSAFREAGLDLGNHTFSHANLNNMTTEAYIKEIKRADSLLKPVLSTPKFFRFPYLAMGSGRKKETILRYLAKKHYQIAPITIDSKDFVFNQRLLAVPELERRGYLEELKPFYLDFIWQQTLVAEKKFKKTEGAQILLIHANLLNAYVLPDIIKLYKQAGYTFVTLQAALSNPDTFMAWD